jgi:hypothetical protein
MKINNPILAPSILIAISEYSAQKHAGQISRARNGLFLYSAILIPNMPKSERFCGYAAA